MLLLSLLFIPILGAFAIFTTKNKVSLINIKIIGLATSIINLAISLLIYILFDFSTNQFQFVREYHEISSFDFYLGVDGLSIYFVLLTTIIIPISLLSNWKSIKDDVKLYFIIILLLETLLLTVFLVLDILLFYIFFESILPPLFLLIGVFGSDNRIKASFYLFLYTLLGSLFLLLSILAMSSIMSTTDFDTLFKGNFLYITQLFLFYGIFIAFAVKTPTIFLNTWLLKAHVESPLGGSIILAAIVLKLSLYGIFRLILPILPKSYMEYTYIIFVIGVITIIYASLSTLRTIDVKELIAYSSVSHAAVYLLGVFSNSIQGIEGGITLGLGHGLVSPGLFICAGGILYDRSHTRIIASYRGMAQIMPLFAILFFILCLANCGAPLSLNFIGEFLSLYGVFEKASLFGLFASSSIVFSAGYTIYMYQKIAFGGIYSNMFSFNFPDLNKREFMILLTLVLPTVIFGIYPAPILDGIHYSVSTLIYSFDSNIISCDGPRAWGLYFQEQSPLFLILGVSWKNLSLYGSVTKLFNNYLSILKDKSILYLVGAFHSSNYVIKHLFYSPILCDAPKAWGKYFEFKGELPLSCPEFEKNINLIFQRLGVEDKGLSWIDNWFNILTSNFDILISNKTNILDKQVLNAKRFLTEYSQDLQSKVTECDSVVSHDTSQLPHISSYYYTGYIEHDPFFSSAVLWFAYFILLLKKSGLLVYCIPLIIYAMNNLLNNMLNCLRSNIITKSISNGKRYINRISPINIISPINSIIKQISNKFIKLAKINRLIKGTICKLNFIFKSNNDLSKKINNNVSNSLNINLGNVNPILNITDPKNLIVKDLVVFMENLPDDWMENLPDDWMENLPDDQMENFLDDWSQSEETQGPSRQNPIYDELVCLDDPEIQNLINKPIYDELACLDNPEIQDLINNPIYDESQDQPVEHNTNFENAQSATPDQPVEDNTNTESAQSATQTNSSIINDTDFINGGENLNIESVIPKLRNAGPSLFDQYHTDIADVRINNLSFEPRELSRTFFGIISKIIGTPEPGKVKLLYLIKCLEFLAKPYCLKRSDYDDNNINLSIRGIITKLNESLIKDESINNDTKFGDYPFESQKTKFFYFNIFRNKILFIAVGQLKMVELISMLEDYLKKNST